MITKFANNQIGNTNPTGSYNSEYRGKSTDTKPVGSNGDVFYEMDTKKVYMYDEATSAWLEQ